MKRMSARQMVGGVAIVALILAATATTSAQAIDAKKTGYTQVRFNSAISGVQTDLAGLTEVLREHTEIAGEALQGANNLVFVYGIGHGDDVYGPIVSHSIELTRGDKPYVARGVGPIFSPWDAFEEPALGFEDPLVGFEDPLVGFEDPLVGLEEIWDNGKNGLEADEYGLVIFTMPDPNAPREGNVTYDAAVVPFTVD